MFYINVLHPFVVIETSVLVDDFVVGCMIQLEVAAHAFPAVAIAIVLQNVAPVHVVPEEGVTVNDVLMIDLVGPQASFPVNRRDLNSLST